MTTVTVARNAMATRFEIVLHGVSAPSLRGAAEEALDEIERLEADLSLYRPTSCIARINARAACEPVRVPPHVFHLLQHAQQLSRETGGAFDITVAPLVRCWGFMAGSGTLPAPEEIAEARSKVGMQLVHLDAGNFTVHFERAGMMLDLGSIGKGYALDRAVDLLREAGIVSGLIHGGTSSVCAIGAPPDADSWKVAVASPADSAATNPARPGSPTLAVVLLRDESLSVSAIWGKSFTADGKVYGHVIDPRLGEPVQGAVLSTCVLPSAAETDAFTTALLTLGTEGHQTIASLRPGMKTLLLSRDAEPDTYLLETNGIAPLEAEIPGVRVTHF